MALTLKKPYRQIVNLLRDFLILVVIGNALSVFIIPREMWSLETVLRNCAFSIAFGYPSFKGMTYIIAVLERKLPWLQYPVKRVLVQFLSLTVFAGVLLMLGFSLWIWFTSDLDFRSVITEIIPSLKVVYVFMILALVLGNTVLFFKNWKEAALQQEELKRAHLALQYQSLRDQVRPHFLFNSLSTLVTLINTDTEKATRFVHKLSDVYRYLLDQRDNELVPLEEEVKFLEDYIFLQRIRFGENLQVHFKADLKEQRMMIPLSLQMIVENAIKHNEISSDHPLVIRIQFNEKKQVVISNNLQKKEVMEHSPGMGIENLRKRIAFFTDDPLVIEERNGAFLVTIPTIPNEPSRS